MREDGQTSPETGCSLDLSDFWRIDSGLTGKRAFAQGGPIVQPLRARQSLGAVQLMRGHLEDAEQTFRESLVRVRHNAWALYGLGQPRGQFFTLQPAAR